MGTFQVQLLLPLLVMVVLTFCVLFTLGCKRVIAVKKRRLTLPFISCIVAQRNQSIFIRYPETCLICLKHRFYFIWR